MRALNDRELDILHQSRPERTDRWTWMTLPEAHKRGLAPMHTLRQWCSGDKLPPDTVCALDVGTRSASRWVVGFAPEHNNNLEARVARLEALVAQLQQQAP